MKPNLHIEFPAEQRRRRRGCDLHNSCLKRRCTPAELTAALAVKVMHWRLGPGRFLLGERRWIPCWRFQPTRNLKDAFRLLEAARPERYAMGANNKGEFWVRAEIVDKVGEATHQSKPLAITCAVARAIGLDITSCDQNFT